MEVHGIGPAPADIMIIGEAPGEREAEQGLPFVGASGSLLDRHLHAAGIIRNSCFVTNVCRFRPPKNDMGEWISENKKAPDPAWVRMHDKWVHPLVYQGWEKLQKEISQVKPKLIIALGNTTLWALTQNWGITSWRGSRLSPPELECTVIPMIHPAAAIRDVKLNTVLKMDFKRAKAIYEGKQLPRDYKFIVSPSFSQTRDKLLELLTLAHEHTPESPLRLAGDLETRRGHIACFGIAWSATEALCIPYLQANPFDPFYWTEEEETELVNLTTQLFQHENILWDGQNYLYDCQYFYRFWGVLPKNVFDTMIGHHAIFSKLRKGLDFLSSMYAEDHVYWKEESKDWDEDLGEEQLWIYNCKDCVITWEISPEIRQTARDFAAGDGGFLAHQEFQQKLFFPVLRMMNRGVALDVKEREHLKISLLAQQTDRQAKLDYINGGPLNPRSSTQLTNLFYHDLKLPVIRAIQTESITTNSPAMAAIALREPVLKPLCILITELRSLGVFLKTFINAELDSDNRMRCAFGVAGSITYRFNSSTNAFGSGMNMQNIPTEEKQKIKDVDYIKLPNIRKLFIPDKGMTFFDMDLDRADLQVVAWEAEDDILKLALRNNLDIHLVNACDIFDIKGIPYDELSEDHPNYKEHRAKIGKQNRDKSKKGAHAVDYGVGDYKLAIELNISRHEAAKFIARWFAMHPGIKKWHQRTERQMHQKGYVTNIFGARLYQFGDYDLPEALGWQPQSVVAHVINQVLINIDSAQQRGETNIELLLQVHDSLGGQFPTEEKEQSTQLLAQLARIVIPYPDPLIIPVGIKTSERSWGDAK